MAKKKTIIVTMPAAELHVLDELNLVVIQMIKECGTLKSGSQCLNQSFLLHISCS